MKREELEKHIGSRVKITLFNNATYFGTLRQGDGFQSLGKWYNIPEEHQTFRLSHVRKLVVLQAKEMRFIK